MSKRKAAADTLSNDTSPQRRRTRSSGPLVDTQPLRLTRSKTRSPSKRTSAALPSKSRSGKSGCETSSLKENEANDADDADELNLSPSKTRRGRASARIIMESVELTTPSRHPSMVSRHTSSSPSPQNPKLRHRDRDIVSSVETSPLTPSKRRITASHHNPSASGNTSLSPAKPNRIASSFHLPIHLHPCLNAQKRAILAALQHSPVFSANLEDEDHDGLLTNAAASQQLSALLTGTVSRGEGNSCLILGPRGSGKTCVSPSYY